jgi:ParB family chromosome partitioning protein
MSKFDFKGMLTQNNQVKELPIDVLVPYHNHQFKLYSGERLDDMVESIRQNGVLSPILVQPIDGGKFEILSGHNRVEGAKTVGLEYIPAVVKENLTAEEAEMYVIETNLIQRGFNELAISEQAKVLQYHNSKMFSQGKRNDILEELKTLENPITTYSHDGNKLKDNPTATYSHDGNKLKDSPTTTYSHDGNKLKKRPTTMDKLGSEYSMSKSSIARVIRVNYLIPQFKEWVDDGRLILVAGVELSYISEENQKALYDFLKEHPKHKKINFKLGRTLRTLFTNGTVSNEELESLIIGEPKSTTRPVKVSLDGEIYEKYFGKDTPQTIVTETIQKALEVYFDSIS